LKQRNDLLKTLQSKKDKDLLLLDIITDQLVGFMELIVKQRQEFLEIIKKHSNRIYQNLSNSEDNLEIKYLPSIKKEFKKELSHKYQYDIITGTTNLGIHRDDIEFYINKSPIKTHGSQGEMRTAVLSIKLALIDFIHQFTNNYPILLLDDVLSELDKDRQNSLLDYIKGKTQTFITATDINEINIKKINNYKVYLIENGTIKESDNYERQL
jgi:DNA replication and repair protein RecF